MSGQQTRFTVMCVHVFSALVVVVRDFPDLHLTCKQLIINSVFNFAFHYLWILMRFFFLNKNKKAACKSPLKFTAGQPEHHRN